MDKAPEEGCGRKITVGGKEYSPPEGTPERDPGVPRLPADSSGDLYGGGSIDLDRLRCGAPDALPPGARMNYVEALRKSGLGAGNPLFRKPPGGEYPRAKRVLVVLLVLAAIVVVLKFL